MIGEDELAEDRCALINIEADTFDWYRSSAICENVWELKYKRETEIGLMYTIDRVSRAIGEDGTAFAMMIHRLMSNAIWFPAGRVIAGAGLPHHDSTLSNCYVMGVLEDSLPSIMKTLEESAWTQKFGGGIGVDFTPLRPKGAEIKTAAYFAGGPIAFMGMWDAMGHALEAGGNRRGGKMAVMAVHHPDIKEFITAKRERGVLTSFNMSVLITDEFMQAVATNKHWCLYSEHRRMGEEGAPLMIDKSGKSYYVWDDMPARELWEFIMDSTYKYSEPGVIFVDRLNDTNPLYYREKITCTNPCGEQPLPPYGACNLGSINLARIVKNPFKISCEIDWALLDIATKYGVIALDRVLDITRHPLDQQHQESMNTRRIGLGITGLADMLAQLGVPYGSQDAERIASDVMKRVTNVAYMTSARLAAHAKLPFPAYSKSHYTAGAFFKRLDPDVQQQILATGLRNGVILSIAPTGTISTVFGDVSSGCEPHFDHKTIRRIKVKDEQNNDTFKSIDTYSYTVRLYAHVHKCTNEEAYKKIVGKLKAYYPTAQTLSPSQHVGIQGALQHWVDSSISKTINVPEDIEPTQLANVYLEAYNAGCKGCTTYRPSETRDAVLIAATPEVIELVEVKESTSTSTSTPVPTTYNGNGRPEILHGVTHKIRWPDLKSPVYFTVNHLPDGRPWEVFIASKNAQFSEWSVALSVMISMLLQRGVEAGDVAEHLRGITLSQSTAWIDGRLYGSIISRLGELLGGHPERVAYQAVQAGTHQALLKEVADSKDAPAFFRRCSFCNSTNIRIVEGCDKCDDCGQSKCG
jgi:ribonucleoside-diphosphate reductase alpha chain